jgi:hypothetical protein
MKPRIAPAIRRVARADLFPYYGYANPGLNTVWVRGDLPLSVHHFVLAHELYHLTDPEKNVLWREIKANMAALRQHPLGGLRCLWMTITDMDRWKLYLKRFREKK